MTARKLTDADVALIRAAVVGRASGNWPSQAALARHFHVSQALVCRIRTGTASRRVLKHPLAAGDGA